MIEARLKKGTDYQDLIVDGRRVASVWGKARVTGRIIVPGLRQVTVDGCDCFLWVDKISWVDEEFITSEKRP